MAFVSNKHAMKLAKLIRNYQKSLNKYARAVPSVEVSEAKCNKAKEDLVIAFKNKDIAAKINSSLSELPKSNLKDRAEAFSKENKDFQEEVKIVSDFGASRNTFITQFDLCSIDKQEPVSSVEEIIDRIEKFHTNFISGIQFSRGLEKKKKKRHKKAYIKMASKLVLGTGCIGLNVFTFTLPMSHFVACTFFYGAAENMLDLKYKD